LRQLAKLGLNGHSRAFSATQLRAGSGSSCPKAECSPALPEPPCRYRRPHSAIEWQRFYSYADRRLVILSGPRAALAEARERAMLMKERLKCSVIS
jgi:hypothetical protein